MPQPAFVMRALGRGGIRETRKWTQRPIPGKRTARPWAQTQSTFFTSPSHTDFLPEETGAGHQFLRFESSASSSAHLNYNIFTGKSFPIDFYKVRAVGFHYAIRPGTNFRVKRFGARLHSFSTKADEKVDYKESSDNPSSTKAFDNSSSSSPPPSLSSPSSSSSDESFSLKKTVVLLTGSQFINNLGFGCVIPVLPLFANDMGLGASGVGLILSTSAVARLCLNIPLGRLSDRIGRKPLMVGGQIGTALASLGTGMCSSLPQLLACRLLLGAGSSSALAGSGAYMADITTRAPNQRAKILGFQSTVINIAYAVGPAVGGYLCDLYGARLMFFIVGGAALLTSAGFSILPETYRGIQHANRVEDSDSDSVDAQKKSNAGAQQASAWQVYRPLLLDPDQQGLIAMNFAVFGSYSALMTVFPLFASSVLGEHGSVAEVGTLFAAGAVIGFVVSFRGFVLFLVCILFFFYFVAFVDLLRSNLLFTCVCSLNLTFLILKPVLIYHENVEGCTPWWVSC